MRTKNIIAFVTSLYVSACSLDGGGEKNGPENSWWLGGDDGGAYIKIEEDSNLNDDIYQGVVFFDHDKTIWYRGPFRLVGDIKFTTENHDLYIFWDGERIHLQQSSYLEAVNPVPPL